jgi:hypothetical protein
MRLRAKEYDDTRSSKTEKTVILSALQEYTKRLDDVYEVEHV